MPRVGIPLWLLLLLVLAVFAFFASQNAPTVSSPVAALPTPVPPTEVVNAWQNVLQSGFGDNSTPLPTVAIPTMEPIMPTLPVIPQGLVPVNAAELGGASEEVADGFGAATPTLPAVVASGTEPSVVVTVQVAQRDPSRWQPPPLIPPISRDPLGRDHFWLARPVDSNARNWILESYPYGSDGPDNTNPLRVHHGVDMPNPVGELVRAAGSGTVIWSADGRQQEVDIFQNSPSYGNVIVIEHDFGYRGQAIWTLYAHLSAAFVQPGQVVERGEVIGLIGNTGRVSGPHLHFEVRIGTNRYGSTYNPVLWMVPYVGHGVIAGRVTDDRGRPVNDISVTIRNRSTGQIEAATTTYVFQGTAFEINPDPIWAENFVVPDVSAGRYDVIATIDGQRVVRQVQVIEGTTAFVELKPLEPPTPTPDGG